MGYKLTNEYEFADSIQHTILDLLFRLAKTNKLLAKSEEIVIENILNTEWGCGFKEEQVEIVMDYLENHKEEANNKNEMVIRLERSGVPENNLLDILKLLYHCRRFDRVIERIDGLQRSFFMT